MQQRISGYDDRMWHAQQIRRDYRIDRMLVAMSALLLLHTPQGMPVVIATEIGVEMTERKDHWPLVEFGCLWKNMSTCLVPPHMLFAWGPHFVGVCGHSERKSSSMPGESVLILRRTSSWRALAQKLQECRHAGHLHSIPWGRWWKSRRWWRWGGFTKNTCQKFGEVLSERWVLRRRPEMELSQDWELMSGILA